MGNNSSGYHRDAVFGSNLSTSSSSRDERIQISGGNAVPYCWTCQLLIESKKGNKYTANGFKLNISPSTGSQVILTSGHSVFIDGAYAKRVSVRFLSSNHRDSYVALENQLWASPQYISTNRPRYDYGLIFLPGESSEGFGWTTLLSDQELMGRPLTTCGYPVDDPHSNLWITGGGVEKISEGHIHYMQDSLGTGSGSPVFTWHKGFWTIVGIQSFGGVFNTAVRLTPDMMHEIMKELGQVSCYTVRPQALHNLYLTKPTTCVSGDTASSNGTSGGSSPPTGGVTCQSTGAAFDVFPLQIEQGSISGRSNGVLQGVPSIRQGLCLYTDASFDDDNGRTDGVASSSQPLFSVKNEFTDPLVGHLHKYYIIHCHNDEGNNAESVSFESMTAEGIYLSTDKSGVIKHINILRGSNPGPNERFILQTIQLQE